MARFRLLAQDVNGKRIVAKRRFQVPYQTAEIVMLCLDEKGEVISEKKWSKADSVALHCKLYHTKMKTD